MSSGSNGSPATAAPSSASRRAIREQRELLAQRRGDGGRHVRAGERDVRDGGERRRTRGRASARVARRRTGCRRSPRRVRRPRPARPRPEQLRVSGSDSAPSSWRASRPLRCARSKAVRSRSGTWRGRIAIASSTGAAGQPAQQRADQLDGAGIGPVQVVEDQHERLARGEHLEQVAHRAVGAVALVLQRRPAAGAEPGEPGEDVRELHRASRVQPLEPFRVEPARRTRRARRRRPRTAGRARAPTPSPRARGARARRRATRARRAGASCRCPARPTSTIAAAVAQLERVEGHRRWHRARPGGRRARVRPRSWRQPVAAATGQGTIGAARWRARARRARTRRACGTCSGCATRPSSAEEERRRDLRIGLAVDDQPRDLELALADSAAMPISSRRARPARGAACGVRACAARARPSPAGARSRTSGRRLAARSSSAAARSRSPACASARPASARETAASKTQPASSSAAAEASAWPPRRPPRRRCASASAAVGARRRSPAAIGSPIASAHSCAARDGRLGLRRCRPASRKQRVSSSRPYARQAPGMRRSSGPPVEASSSSAASSASPVSSSGAASAHAACAEMMLSSRRVGELDALARRRHRQLDVAGERRRRTSG